MHYHNSVILYFDRGDVLLLSRDLKLKLRERASIGSVDAFFGTNWVFLHSLVGFSDEDLYTTLRVMALNPLKIEYDVAPPPGMISNPAYLFLAIEASSDNSYECDILEFSAWCGTEKQGLFDGMVSFHKVLSCEKTALLQHSLNGLASETADSNISLRGLEVLFLDWLKLVILSMGEPVLVTPSWVDYAVLRRLCPDIVEHLEKLPSIDTYNERLKLEEQVGRDARINPWKVYNHHRSEGAVHGAVQQFSIAHLLLAKNGQ